MTWPPWWEAVAGAAVALLAVYVALVLALLRGRPRGVSLTDAVRLLPDVVRLLRRLAADRSVPAPARVRLWLLLGYLAVPIDLVPDVVPVLGYADDVLLALLVLRAVVRHAGVPALERHWPGAPEGLRAVLRLVEPSPPRERGRGAPPRGRAVAAVAAGGALGGAARYLVALALPASAPLPWATLAVNVLGAFLLGLLLVVLPVRAPDRPYLLLFVATGVLGSFTTFSTWMLEAEALAAEGSLLASVGYVAVTLAAGLLAVAAGVLLGRRVVLPLVRG